MTANSSLNAQRPKRTPHPNSLANLKPWPKGTSGNAKGTPGPKITPRIERMLQMTPEEFFRLKLDTVADVIAAGYVFEAMQSGYDKGRTEVIERIDGKVPNVVESDVTVHKVETVVVSENVPTSLRAVK